MCLNIKELPKLNKNKKKVKLIRKRHKKWIFKANNNTKLKMFHLRMNFKNRKLQ
jgi:hypothetical protein